MSIGRIVISLLKRVSFSIHPEWKGKNRKLQAIQMQVFANTSTILLIASGRIDYVVSLLRAHFIFFEKEPQLFSVEWRLSAKEWMNPYIWRPQLKVVLSRTLPPRASYLGCHQWRGTPVLSLDTSTFLSWVERSSKYDTRLAKTVEILPTRWSE